MSRHVLFTSVSHRKPLCLPSAYVLQGQAQAAYDFFVQQVGEEVRKSRQEELKGTSQEGEEAAVDASVQAARERVQQKLRLSTNGNCSSLQWEEEYKRNGAEETAWVQT